MQFSAIWAPPSVGGWGRGAILQYGMPSTLYVIMFCLCFIFAFQFLFFYVAQRLIVYNKMKVEKLWPSMIEPKKNGTHL